MDQVTTILNSPTFHDLEWVGSIEEGKLNVDDFEEPYHAGIFCLLHKNLIQEAVTHFEKSTLTEAMYIMGRRYFDDSGNDLKGTDYLNKAYANGNLDAGYSLVRLYSGGSDEINPMPSVSRYICDELHNKSYNQVCTPHREGFYSFCANLFYAENDIKKAMIFFDLAIKNGCTCCYGFFGSYTARENNHQKAIEMYMKIDFTKCLSDKPTIYWNIARAYEELHDYKNAVKFFIMASQHYEKEEDIQDCHGAVTDTITEHPEIIIELVREKRLKIE